MKTFFKQMLVSYLVVAMFVIGIAPNVNAGFSPSQLTGVVTQSRQADLQRVRSFLEMKIVADRFTQLGFSPVEVQSRLSTLSDEQLHRIALKVEDIKVGGDGGTAVIIILIIVVFALIILRLLRLI
jgi:hypothetical protein